MHLVSLAERLNRTFMELKLAKEEQGVEPDRVLIEPLWN